MEILQLLLDFGMVILIWMTQLVVYPSFKYYQPEDLVVWHQKYTTAISLLVIPLMCSQLALHGYDLWMNWNLVSTMSFLLIVLLWIITFGLAVPLHGKITRRKEVMSAARTLVDINWYRTVLWSLVFLISVYQYLKIY